VLLLRNKALFEGKWLSAIHHVRLQRCMAEYKLKTTQNIQYFVSYIFTPQKKKQIARILLTAGQRVLCVMAAIC